MKRLTLIITALFAVLAMPALAQDRPAGYWALDCDHDMWRATRDAAGNILYYNNRTCVAHDGGGDSDAGLFGMSGLVGPSNRGADNGNGGNGDTGSGDAGNGDNGSDSGNGNGNGDASANSGQDRTGRGDNGRGNGRGRR